MTDRQPAIFDGHNDVLSKLARAGDGHRPFIDGRDGALDLAKARAGNFAGGFFAVWVPTPVDLDAKFDAMTQETYDLPMPMPPEWGAAVRSVAQQISLLTELDRAGAVKLCRTTTDIRAAMAEGTIAAICHVEGAEAIDPELQMLDLLHAAGMRSLGLVWSRQTIFGTGVPFRFPSDGDIGGGLTEAGIRLVRRCDALGVMLDLSHLNAAGFWDVARHSTRPLVATHSNAHAICPHSRNLTDAQLDAIAATGGMVGVNLAVAFLRADGQMRADVGFDQVMRHFDHLIGRLGEDCVGLGSDYDGAVVPKGLETVADLPKLRHAMAAHGYGAALIDKLCNGNWLRVLDRSWGQPVAAAVPEGTATWRAATRQMAAEETATTKEETI